MVEHVLPKHRARVRFSHPAHMKNQATSRVFHMCGMSNVPSRVASRIERRSMSSSAGRDSEPVPKPRRARSEVRVAGMIFAWTFLF